MIDPGLIVIVLVVGLVAWAIWSWRSGKRTAYEDTTPAQPGRRLEGSDHVGGGSND